MSLSTANPNTQPDLLWQQNSVRLSTCWFVNSVTVRRLLHVTSRIKPRKVLFWSSSTDARGSVDCTFDMASFFLMWVASRKFLGTHPWHSAPHTPSVCFTLWKSALFIPCCIRFSFNNSMVLCFVLACAALFIFLFPCAHTSNFSGVSSKW